MEPALSEPAWTCSTCGQDHDETFDACWNCGASRDAPPPTTVEGARCEGMPERARCPTCSYPLRGLPSPECPECGRHFDPDDPRTYSVDGVVVGLCCLSCDYPLHGLAERRCPECGRAFDPADPATYHTGVRPTAARSYDVYRHPTRGYQAVKQGFCWPGFFFVFVWAFVKELWLAGLALFILLAGVELLADVVPLLRSVPVGLIVAVGVGVGGNALRRTSLRRAGYELVGRYSADRPADAVHQMDGGDDRDGLDWRQPHAARRVVVALLLAIVLTFAWDTMLVRLL